MIKLRLAKSDEADTAMEIINSAKAFLKAQGVDQWQTGYPDDKIIKQDIATGKGYFAVDDDQILGYLCVDFDGEPAYDGLKGEWQSNADYVVVHRLAFGPAARGKGASGAVFSLVEELSRQKGVHYFRIDTDGDNQIMQHVIKKNGFTYRGKIWFDNSDKIAFDKEF